jgi:two-component system OmpR family response regulator
MRVLLVEDEPVLGMAVQEHVSGDGHAVDLVERVEDAEAALRAVDYALMLLDLRLPDGSGLGFLRALRRRGDTRPVIILTACDQVRDRIDGLNAGADDYLVKPFDLHELSARVRAVARRSGGNPNPVFRRGAVEVDQSERRVSCQGRDVTLTSREWAVLEQLLQRPDATIAKDRLEESLYAFGAEIESNAVEVYVSRLRKKLGRDFIRTARGVGYRIGA